MINWKNRKLAGTLCWICLAGCTVSASETEVQERIVTEIQMNGVRFTAEEFGTARLDQLVEDAASLTPSEDEITLDEQNKDHIVLSLVYEGGERDTLCFHQVEDCWYVRNQEGIVYDQADFVTDYVSVVTADENSENVQMGVELAAPDMEVISLLLEDGGLDERYSFVNQVTQKVKAGMTEEEAEASVRKAMLSEWKLAQYAQKYESESVQEEAEEIMEMLLESVRQAENYEEVCAELQRVGLTMEEYIRTAEEAYRRDVLITRMYREKYEEYRHGNCRIGDKDCRKFDDYWNCFLLETAEPEMNTYDISEFEEQLERASSFYRTHCRDHQRNREHHGR